MLRMADAVSCRAVAGRLILHRFLAKYQTEQTIHQPGAAVGAAHRHVRHDAHGAVADDLHELHHRVALRAKCVHAGAR